MEPTDSPVISGGQPGPHPIQGIGAGFIPDNLHTQSIDGAIQVAPADAKAMAYVPLKLSDGEVIFGVGVDSNIDQAAVHAIIAGLNRVAKK